MSRRSVPQVLRTQFQLLNKAMTVARKIIPPGESMHDAYKSYGEQELEEVKQAADREAIKNLNKIESDNDQEVTEVQGSELMVTPLTEGKTILENEPTYELGVDDYDRSVLKEMKITDDIINELAVAKASSMDVEKRFPHCLAYQLAAINIAIRIRKKQIQQLSATIELSDINKELVKKWNIESIEVLNEDDRKGSTDQQASAVTHNFVEHCRNTGIGLRQMDKVVYVWNGLYWERIEQDKLIQVIRVCALRMGIYIKVANTSRFESEIMPSLLRCITGVPEVLPRRREEILFCCLNGVFAVTKDGVKSVKPHPEQYIRYCIPTNYSPGREPGEFRKLLNDLIKNKSYQDTLAEFISSAFTDYKHEKAMFLFGDGEDGKSTLMDIVRALFGAQASRIGLAKLCDEKGNSRCEAIGKLINFSSESDISVNLDNFKLIVSRESISVERKFVDAYTTSDMPRLLTAINRIPKMSTGKDILRRALIIQFYKIKGNPDTEIANRIIENDLESVMTWVIEGLIRLVANKGVIKNHEMSSYTESILRESNVDAIYEFNESGDHKSATATVIYDRFKQFCEGNGYDHKGINATTISSMLEKLGWKKNRKNNIRLLEPPQILAPDF